MPKRQIKKQKFNDLANAIGQIRRGEPVKRIGAKDGSIRTHPVVLVDSKKLEREVKADCLDWLVAHDVFRNLHGCGSFINERGQRYMYGIKNAGDIHGMLKNHNGKHFEIECKRGSGGQLSKGQQDRMKDIHWHNGLYFIVHGFEELAHFMGEWV